mgnify:CR=1 FL=1
METQRDDDEVLMKTLNMEEEVDEKEEENIEVHSKCLISSSPFLVCFWFQVN